MAVEIDMTQVCLPVILELFLPPGLSDSRCLSSSLMAHGFSSLCRELGCNHPQPLWPGKLGHHTHRTSELHKTFLKGFDQVESHSKSHVFPAGYEIIPSVCLNLSA